MELGVWCPCWKREDLTEEWFREETYLGISLLQAEQERAVEEHPHPSDLEHYLFSEHVLKTAQRGTRDAVSNEVWFRGAHR